MKNICLILLLLSETARLNAQCSPDQIPPLLVPKINAAAPLGGPHCTAAVLPEQLLSSFSDNCTANPGISLRVRRAGAGAGLPLLPAGGQLLLTPDDFGAPVFAEVWARDAAGNTAFLYTRLTVQNPGGCAFALLPDTISAGAGLPQGIGLEDVSWLVSASLPPGAPVSTWELDQNLVLGADLFDGPAQDKIFEIQPSKDDNPLNGVTTYDAVLMLLDILQVQALGNPYKYLAADVNRDRRVNVADVVDLRKLVLGIYTELPDSPSWRFVPADYVFPFPNQPFYEIVPESIVFDRHRSAPLPDFIPLKVGDLNYNALLNSLQETDDRQTAELWLPDLPIQAGERVRVPVSLTGVSDLFGLQTVLRFNPAQLELLGIEPAGLIDFSSQHFFQPEPGLLTLSWLDQERRAPDSEQPLFFLELKAHQNSRLSAALVLASERLKPEVYSSAGAVSSLRLRFSPADIPPAAGALGYPNPATEVFHLQVELPVAGPVRVEIFSAGGQLMAQQEKQLPAGRHLFEMANPGWSGVFSYRLHAGGSVQSGRVVFR